MNEQFQRLLSLVKRTGDRLVVLGQDGKSTFVIMGLEQYEDIIDVEDELLGRFDETAQEQSDQAPAPSDIWQAMPPAGESADTWDIDRMDDRQVEEVRHAYREHKKEGREQTTDQAADRGNEETPEEQFYLEPVE